MDKIDLLQEMINESKNIVFFTGAGVSTESGLKDFRSKDGLYNKSNSKFSTEYMLSAGCFYDRTKDFYDFYRENFNCLNILPNITHKYLKKLEDSGKLKGIVTQNIDGLHTKAGNTNVYEIHGTIYKNNCIKCGKEYEAEYVFNCKDIPKCECGGIIKPDVVLYGEMLPEKEYFGALRAINEADMLVVIGSSLTVYPANGMIDAFQGKYLVIINQEPTFYDNKANLVINEKLSKVLGRLKDNL